MLRHGIVGIRGSMVVQTTAMHDMVTPPPPPFPGFRFCLASGHHRRAVGRRREREPGEHARDDTAALGLRPPSAALRRASPRPGVSSWHGKEGTRRRVTIESISWQWKRSYYEYSYRFLSSCACGSSQQYNVIQTAVFRLDRMHLAKCL